MSSCVPHTILSYSAFRHPALSYFHIISAVHQRSKTLCALHSTTTTAGCTVVTPASAVNRRIASRFERSFPRPVRVRQTNRGDRRFAVRRPRPGRAVNAHFSGHSAAEKEYVLPMRFYHLVFGRFLSISLCDFACGSGTCLRKFFRYCV